MLKQLTTTLIIILSSTLAFAVFTSPAPPPDATELIYIIKTTDEYDNILPRTKIIIPSINFQATTNEKGTTFIQTKTSNIIHKAIAEKDNYYGMKNISFSPGQTGQTFHIKLKLINKTKEPELENTTEEPKIQIIKPDPILEEIENKTIIDEIIEKADNKTIKKLREKLGIEEEGQVGVIKFTNINCGKEENQDKLCCKGGAGEAMRYLKEREALGFIVSGDVTCTDMENKLRICFSEHKTQLSGEIVKLGEDCTEVLYFKEISEKETNIYYVEPTEELAELVAGVKDEEESKSIISSTLLLVVMVVIGLYYIITKKLKNAGRNQMI